MNKGEKVTVILMLTVIAIYIVLGVHKTRVEELNKNNEISGDSLYSGDSLNDDEENPISYELSSGDDTIVLKAYSEGFISTTIYKFENEKLISITLEEEVTSGDDTLVENMYNYMKDDEDISMVYSEIDKNGNVITAVLREEYVDSYGDADKEEVYNKLATSLELSKE